MSVELNPEQEKAFAKLTKAVAEGLTAGRSKGAIVKDLTKNGWPEDTAAQFVDRVQQAMDNYTATPEGRRELAAKYSRHMLYGALWAVGGAAVTAITYAAASGGGRYVIFWGAIIFGIFDFIRGLVGWMKYRD